MNSEDWSLLEIVLGTPLLARICGPFDDSHNAARLEYLTDVVTRLRRSYDTLGVQEWFLTKSPTVGVAPVELLTGAWNPHDLHPRQLRDVLPPARS